MLGIGRFSGRAAAASVVVVIIFSLLKWPSKEKLPQNKEKIQNYFFGGISLPRETILGSIQSACLLKWPSKEKFPQHKDSFPNYFFGVNFAAPGAGFR